MKLLARTLPDNHFLTELPEPFLSPKDITVRILWTKILCIHQGKWIGIAVALPLENRAFPARNGMVRVCHQERGQPRGESCSACRVVVGGRATPSTSTTTTPSPTPIESRAAAAAILMNVAVFIAGAIHGFLLPDLVMRLDTTKNNSSANI